MLTVDSKPQTLEDRVRNLELAANPGGVMFRLDLGAKPPTRGFDGDAGWDLYTNEEFTIFPDMLVNAHTGVYIAMSDGLWGRITSRSSTWRTHGLQIVEGIIDNGYRGELFIQVSNPSSKPVRVERGLRLAQFILHQTVIAKWTNVDELPSSDRGQRGFGSTGR